MPFAVRNFVVVLISCFYASFAYAQWSDDPAQNLRVTDRSGEQTQTKIVVRSDGGSYVSWFDNGAGGGYDVYLQRLDAQGRALWADNGILIADRGFSSTQDYDLAVDQNDDALLTFRDDRPGGTQITATKVDELGTEVWGAGGVQLTNTTDFVAAPKIVATSNNLVFVAWAQDGSVRLQQLSSAEGAGTLMGDVVLTDPGEDSYAASDLIASDDGAVIVLIVKGFFSATLHVQRVGSSGGTSWGPGVVVPVFTGGTLQIGNFPECIPDGQGGAIVGWYSSSPSLQCFVQRILSDGTMKFLGEGVAVSELASQNRVNPSIAYRPQTDSIYCFWHELNSTQSMHGVSGQHVNSNGVRVWGPNGKTVVPLQANELTQVRTAESDGDGIVFWTETLSFGNQQLRGARIENQTGDFVWTPNIIDIATTASGKSRLDLTESPFDVSLLVWKDTRNDDGDVYAQKVNADGSLDAPPGDIVGDGVVDVFDLLELLDQWGACDAPCPPTCAADITDENGVGPDCVVDTFDLLLLLKNWG